MQISLRSHLIAGVAAAGATAIVLTPVVTPQLAPAAERVSAAVALSALTNPITAITETLAMSADYLFGQAALLDPAELFWPDSYYTPDFSFLFSPDYIGIAPDLVNQFSSGAISGLVNNLSGYANAGLYGITSLVGGLSQAVFDLLTLDIAQALADVQFAIGAVVQGVGYLVDNVIRNVSTIITNTIPGLIGKLVDTTINGSGFLLQSLAATIGEVVTNLTTFNLEGAWNAAVDGLLGRDGTLGRISDLTIGIGIIEPVDYGPPDGEVLTVVIPSLRSAVTSTFQRLGDLAEFGDGGIVNAPYEPVVVESAAAVAEPAAASARAAVEAAAAPAVATGADASSSAAVEAPAAADVERPVAGTSEAAPAPATDSAAEASAPAATPAGEGASAQESGSAKKQASRGGRGGSAS